MHIDKSKNIDIYERQWHQNKTNVGKRKQHKHDQIKSQHDKVRRQWAWIKKQSSL